MKKFENNIFKLIAVGDYNTKLPRAKRESKKGGWSTDFLKQSERLRSKTGPPIASSETTGKEGESGQQITSSEARSLEMRPVPKLLKDPDSRIASSEARS